MATLKDVAERAGVSVSTVSYVLNGQKKVKDETLKRINDAIQELGYLPNMIARGLKTNVSNTIGVIVTDLDNLFFVDIVRVIETTALKYNYNVILCNSRHSTEREEKHIKNLVGQRIDGMIIAGTGENCSASLGCMDIPVVTIERGEGVGSGSVIMDDVFGGQLATQYLVDKGRMPMAILTFSLSFSTFRNRVHGCRKALEANGYEYNENLMVEAEFGSYSEGYYAAKELLERKIKFNSLFACNDLLALGAMRAFMESGLRIPEDVAVVGYDDIQISKIFVPSLTTVAQSTHDIGVNAVRLLHQLMKNEEIKESKIKLAPQLIIREST